MPEDRGRDGSSLEYVCHVRDLKNRVVWRHEIRLRDVSSPTQLPMWKETVSVLRPLDKVFSSRVARDLKSEVNSLSRVWYWLDEKSF